MRSRPASSHPPALSARPTQPRRIPLGSRSPQDLLRSATVEELPIDVGESGGSTVGSPREVGVGGSGAGSPGDGWRGGNEAWNGGTGGEATSGAAEGNGMGMGPSGVEDPQGSPRADEDPHGSHPACSPREDGADPGLADPMGSLEQLGASSVGKTKRVRMGKMGTKMGGKVLSAASSILPRLPSTSRVSAMPGPRGSEAPPSAPTSTVASEWWTSDRDPAAGEPIPLGASAGGSVVGGSAAGSVSVSQGPSPPKQRGRTAQRGPMLHRRSHSCGDLPEVRLHR